ncbi:hypothetical protein FPOAC2_07295 [Fusarium poae]
MANSRYVYSALANDKNTRLLRLSPSTSFSDRIEGYLFEYTLSKSTKNAHLYEALSYTWGSPDTKHSIWIEGNELPITANCHAALARLRDDCFDRIIWVDAICIDQANKDERGMQVQLMAEIYCKASQVIVWLGEPTPETAGAFEIIRCQAEGRWITSEPRSVLALLRRPWFRRIWVLQEVAAARHVVVACGESQIKGDIFCLGLPGIVYEDSSFAAVRSIEFLIRGSIFRPKYEQDSSGRVALGIRPLGQLMDMYHSHEATEPLDTIFALIGMSKDAIAAPELVPNYNTPWHDLFARLIHFVLGSEVSVATYRNKRTAMVYGRGIVVGKVLGISSRSKDRDLEVSIEYAEGFHTDGLRSNWTVHPAVNRIAYGDVVCWLRGASHPMVIRPHKTYWTIIMISVTPPSSMRYPPPMSTLLNFIVVWDLRALQSNAQDPTCKWWLADKVLSFADPHPQRSVREIQLSRRVAQILIAAGRHDAAAQLFEDVPESYRSLRSKDDLLMIECLEELATAHENLEQWAAAKPHRESIVRTSYAIKLRGPDIIAFSERLLVTLKRGGYVEEERKWRAATRILQAKEYGILLTIDKVLQIISTYDSEIVNIVFDQWDDGVCVNEWILIAAA